MNVVSLKNRSAHSLGLLGCVALWFAAICVWYENSASKDGWSQTPLFWMLVLVVAPLSCIAAAVVLLRARRLAAQRLSWLDWCALVAGVLAVSIGGLLVVMVVSSMRGMGIL